MKRLVTFVCFFVALALSHTMVAQFSITLNVESNPTPKILEWAVNPQTVQLTVANLTSNTERYKIKAQLYKDNELIGETRIEASPLRIIEANAVEINFAEDVVPESAVKLYGNIEKTVIKTGRIPAGTYRLCTKLVDESGNIDLTTEVCQTFFVSSYQQPRLILPLDGSPAPYTGAVSSLNFQWSPVMPQPRFPVYYQIRVVPKMEGQTALYAFRYNTPIINENVPGSTNFIWPVNTLEIDPDTDYVWGVIAMDEDEKSIGENEGLSEIWGFRFVDNTLVRQTSGIDVIKCQYEINSFGISVVQKLPSDSDIKYVEYNYTAFVDNMTQLGYDYIHGERRFEHQVLDGNCPNARFVLQGISTSNNVRYQIHVDDCHGAISNSGGSNRTAGAGTGGQSNIVEFTFKAICSSDLKYKISGQVICTATKINYYRYYNGQITLLDNPDEIPVSQSQCDIIAKINTSINDKRVNFTSTVNNNMGVTPTVSYIWDFGDGNTSTNTNKVHTYASLGIYEVTLEATFVVNDVECKSIDKKTIKLIPDCDDAACNFDCTTTLAGQLVSGESIDLCGGLVMFINTVSGTNASLSGTGIVYIPWLLTAVNVNFQNIKVNASRQFCSGEINATIDNNAPSFPTQWAINVGYHLTESQIGALNDYVNNKMIDQQEVLDRLGISDPPPDIVLNTIKDEVQPINLPLGFKFKTDGNSIAISSMRFTPQQNYLKASAKVTPFEDDGENEANSFEIYFESNNFFFNDKGPILHTGGGNTLSFELLANKTLIYTGASGNLMKIIFNAKDANHIGTGFIFVSDCNKPLKWCFRLDTDIEFPRKWIIPSPDNGNSVFAHLEQEFCDFKDYIAELDLPKCEIVNTNGLILEATGITWDRSTLRNATGMVFPNEYQGSKTNLFKGFYLKNAKLILPDGFRTYEDPTQLITIDFNNWIIEGKHGFTGDLLVTPVVNFPSMNVSDLGASLDTFRLEMVRNEIKKGYMAGKITLPICDYDIPGKEVNFLHYKALFTNVSSDKSFTFQVFPDRKLTCDLFADGKLELNNTSRIKIVIGENENRSFDFALNGKLDFRDQKIKVPLTGIEYDLKMDATFQNIKLNYSTNASGDEFNFEPGQWSFASPQKSLAKFPFTVQNYKPIVDNISFQGGGLVFKGGISFDFVLNLDDVIGGRTNLGVVGSVSKQNGRLKPKFEEIRLNDIDLYANLAAVQVEGAIRFYNNDPIFGNAVGGYIKAVFKTVGTQVEVKGMFGIQTNPDDNLPYRYWQFSAMFIAPPPGITLAPGLALRGAGLGAYRNMTANFSNVSINIPNSVTTLQVDRNGGPEFTPVKGSWGFNIKAVLASSPNEEAANGDISIGATFVDGGISVLNIAGNILIGSKIGESSKAIMSGTFNTYYNFVSKEFDFTAIVNLNKPPITTPGGLTLKINSNGKTDKWSVKFGTPSIPNSVNVFTISLYSYLMFGNDIPAPSDFTQSFKNSYRMVTGYYPFANANQISNVNDETQLGKGFAFGVGFKKSAITHGLGRSDDKDDDGGFRPSVYFNVDAGAELNLSMFKYNQTSCLTGWDGTYAKGSIGFYAKFTAGFWWYKKGRSCDLGAALWKTCKGGYTDPNGYYQNLFTVSAAGALTAGFPNPEYLKGEAYINFEWKGFSKSFKADFQFGQNCSTGSYQGAGNTYVSENATDKIERTFIKQIGITQGELFDYRKPINVEFTYPISGYLFNNPNSQIMGTNPFDVAERQADGSIKSRTFYVLYAYEFKRQMLDGTFKNFDLKRSVNATGTHDYYDYSVNTSGTIENDENGWPIPNPPFTNKFRANSNYQFKVLAALYEIDDNGQATPAKDRNNQPITEIKNFEFTTIPIVQTSGSIGNSSPVIITNTGTTNQNLNSISNQNNNENGN